jgi:hypothetical protein
MAIVRTRLTKILASVNKSKKATSSSIEISNKNSIESVKKEKIKGIGDVIEVEFSLETQYEPNIGNIEIEGTIVYHDKDLKKQIEEKDGKIVLLEDAFLEVNNTILAIGSVQSLLMAKEMNLPSPIQLPMVEASKKAKGKGGKGYA